MYVGLPKIIELLWKSVMELLILKIIPHRSCAYKLSPFNLWGPQYRPQRGLPGIAKDCCEKLRLALDAVQENGIFK